MYLNIMKPRDLVRTIMFYLYIVIMKNKITKIRIKHSFDVCSF